MMKCPRCVQRIHRAAESCPHCGFSIADMDARHGADHPILSSLADRAGILKRDERKLVQDAMRTFSATFPQLFVVIYTGSFGNLENLRQFSFWLLNRSTFDDLPPGKQNHGGILLTIDPNGKLAGFSHGYLLDAFLDESDTFECLSRAHAYWLEGRYADGITKAILHLRLLLKQKCRIARRNPKRFLRNVMPKTMASRTPDAPQDPTMEVKP